MIVYICTTTPSLNFKNLNFTSAPTSVSRSASHRKLVRLPQGPAPTTPDQDTVNICIQCPQEIQEFAINIYLKQHKEWFCKG